MSPRELAYWMASFKLDPPGDEWETHSTMATSIINEIRQVGRQLGGEASDFLKPDDLVPHRHEKKGSTDAEAVDALFALEGLPE